MAHVSIGTKELDALARTTMSEVGHFGRYGNATLKCGCRAVVDTIINRTAHPSYPNTVGKVVNQPWQFSAIGAPGGAGTWKNLPKARAAVAKIVRNHVRDRAAGAACTVQGASHFLNPHFSSSSALRRWGNHVVRNAVRICGRGRDIHYHGYAPRSGPPPGYTLSFEGKSCDFSGRGVAQHIPATVSTTAIEASIADFEELDYARLDTSNVRSSDLSAGERSLTEPDLDDIDFSDDEADLTEPSLLEMKLPPVLDQGGLLEAEAAPLYRVERIAGLDPADLQESLNSFSAEGWRLRQSIPDKEGLVALLEQPQTDESETESDDDFDALTFSHLITSLENDGVKALEGLTNPLDFNGGAFDMAAFTALVESWNLEHFSVSELLFLGNGHYSGACKNKNARPPKKYWGNIEKPAKVLDKLRKRLGAPIRITSGYRNPSYNACVDGRPGSRHKIFNAIDFKCSDGRGSVHWARTLKHMRDRKEFVGGIGVYSTFVHIDTRSYNAEFGPWRDRVF